MRAFYIVLSILVFSILVIMIYQERIPEKEHATFQALKVSNSLKQNMIETNVWNVSCPVPVERLRLLKVSYYDFSGAPHYNGKIMVMDVAAANTLKIFSTLFENKFPIHSIKLMNHYNGNDNDSMTDNNSSAFNCRNISKVDELSSHAYGLAIDINPIQNPFLDTSYHTDKSSLDIMPLLGIKYVNRINIRKGMVETVLNNGETVIDIFTKNGYPAWGGRWNWPIDWHHFQVPTEDAKKLLTMSATEAQEYYDKLVAQPQLFSAMDHDNR